MFRKEVQTSYELNWFRYSSSCGSRYTPWVIWRVRVCVRFGVNWGINFKLLRGARLWNKTTPGQLDIKINRNLGQLHLIKYSEENVVPDDRTSRSTWMQVIN